VREIDPYSIGVHPSELAIAHAADAPYIGRDIDAVLDQRLADCWHGADKPVVAVCGTSMSGKSRTLWEALKRVVPDATVYAVRSPRQSDGSNPAARPIPELLAQGDPRNRQGTLIWVDDAHDHVNHGLDVDTLRDLCNLGMVRAQRSVPVLIVLTINIRRLEDITEFDRPLAYALRAASTGTVLGPTLTSASELNEAKRLYPRLADDPELERVPELFASVPLVRDRLDAGRSSDREGVAVARAAVMWRSAGMPAGIDRFDLHELAALLLREDQSAAEFEEARFAEALLWATQPVASHVNLVRRSVDSGERRYTASGALLKLCEERGETIPREVWAVLLTKVSQGTGNGVGIAAFAANELRVAERAFVIASDAPGADGARACSGLGLVRQRQGDLDGAAAAYQQAVDRGFPVQTAQAELDLGLIRHEHGELERAAAAYQHTITHGIAEQQAVAALHLGILRYEQGDLAGAAVAYERAIETGIAEPAARAAFNLELLRKIERDTEPAAEADQRATDRAIAEPATAAETNPSAIQTRQADQNEEPATVAETNPSAIQTRQADQNEEPATVAETNPSAIQARQTDRTEAEAAAKAVFELGLLQHEQGDFDGAVAAYQEAIESGAPGPAANATINLGLLRYEQGEADTADAYQHAIDGGFTEQAASAALNLGLLRSEQGDAEGAARAYQQAINTGIAEPAAQAALSLGVLRENQRDAERAAVAYQYAVASGIGEPAAQAAFNLGLLREKQGDIEAAASAYQHAINSGIPKQAAKAAINTGLLRHDAGDIEAARRAYQYAIDLGVPKQAAQAAINLGMLRYEQGDLEGAAAALQQAINSGVADEAANASVNLGLVRREQGDVEGAVAAYQRAIDSGQAEPAAEAAANLGVLRKEQRRRRSRNRPDVDPGAA
jgi:Tfp pilus assembly protein PilF